MLLDAEKMTRECGDTDAVVAVVKQRWPNDYAERGHDAFAPWMLAVLRSLVAPLTWLGSLFLTPNVSGALQPGLPLVATF